MTSKTLTLSQAHKIYTGSSMWLYALKLGICGVLMYFASILSFFVISMLSKWDASDALKEITDIGLINIFLTVDAGIILMITGLMQYNKAYPGGKYFRTVNGGFETYRKMKAASTVARVTALMMILIFGVLVDVSGTFTLTHGISGAVYIGAFLLVCVGLIDLLSLIKSPALRGCVTPIIIFGAGALGVVTPDIFDGKLYFPIAVAAFAVPLIIISQKVMLANYKKHKWN